MHLDGIMIINMIKQIITPSSPIRNIPNSFHPFETEGLFGEKFLINKSKGSWSYGKLKNDGYIGWIRSKDLGEIKKVTHKISSVSSVVYKEKDFKSALYTLPFGSLVNVIKEEDIFVKILINNNFCYLLKRDIMLKNEKLKMKLNKICEKFLNIPYFWGGKTYMGLDCSSLLQLSLSVLGYKIKRNTSQQIQEKIFMQTSLEKIKSDDLIFWDGHVAIVKNKIFLIHANAFTMKVSIEPIDQTISRLSGNGLEIKKIVRI